MDEGHRIKNKDCRLVKELKHYKSANRLLLTGTPLQNNLKELWSLLHFIMPVIFNDFKIFDSSFEFSKSKTNNLLAEQNMAKTLHGILKPFLLRRIKLDGIQSKIIF
jgi:ATP-dependent DNA helicase